MGLPKWILPLMFSLFLLSCSSSAETKEFNNPSESDVYPGIAEPDAYKSFPETIVVPTPLQNKGVVTGYLLISGESEPYLTTLLLGKLIYADDPSAPPLVEYSVESSPVAEMSQSGHFVFKDIDPGEYGIVIWSPINHVLLSDPNSGEYVRVIVKAGEETDLGTLFVK